MTTTTADLFRTSLWADLLEIPSSLDATLAVAEGFEQGAELLAAPSTRRIVATGNGAAYYVGQALWLASLETPLSVPPVVAIPAGVLVGHHLRWRDGDVLLAVSSSGEFRDVIDAVEQASSAGLPVLALTATATSTLAHRAGMRAMVQVLHQRAVTHTQVLCSNVLAILAMWAEATGDGALRQAVEQAPDAVRQALRDVPSWAETPALADLVRPTSGVVFGTGPAWAAASEAALLLREVAGVPAEGAETREGATSSMYALSPGQLVIGLPSTPGDPLLAEALAVCEGAGAAVMELPAPLGDPRLAAVTSHPHAVCLAAHLGLRAGADVDHPSWESRYYATARSGPQHVAEDGSGEEP